MVDFDEKLRYFDIVRKMSLTTLAERVNITIAFMTFVIFDCD